MEEVSSSSSEVKAIPLPPQHQVFVNFRGEELRNNFVSHLRSTFERHGVNIFIDTNEERGKHLNVLFERIEDSRIALAIFSVRYSESQWCLNELLKMKECMDNGKLLIIPIFYKVTAADVRYQKGLFGYFFKQMHHVDVRKKNQWSEALNSVADRFGFPFDGKRLWILKDLEAEENNYGSGVASFVVIVSGSVLTLVSESGCNNARQLFPPFAVCLDIGVKLVVMVKFGNT
ncbi:PREDICTED: disease resistance-like protein CSA1 [Camelina sativa]|uniref:Disease resistance-like protein CSA1 n=1 Tax=Camelina sativa TaxID=90675 RepID=A0ABM0TTQ8_CAMSA|nr:PREDICTED: disease resistance-like protein CSA1 [Camelina sativa]